MLHFGGCYFVFDTVLEVDFDDDGLGTCLRSSGPYFLLFAFSQDLVVLAPFSHIYWRNSSLNWNGLAEVGLHCLSHVPQIVLQCWTLSILVKFLRFLLDGGKECTMGSYSR